MATRSFHLQQKMMAAGITGPEGHALSRPPDVEGEAANRVIAIAAVLGAPIYIVHVSTAEATDAIARARATGQRVYGEVLAQHLLIDESVYQNKDWATAAAYVMSPPFRAKHHQAGAVGWAGFRPVADDGDRSLLFLRAAEGGRTRRLHPHPQRHRRHRGSHERAVAPRRRHRSADAERVRAHHLHQHGADLQFVSAQGRRCRSGADADLVVWDAHASRTISVKTHHQNIDFNVYEGMEVTGLARHTISQGKLVWTDGDLRTVRGAGRYIERPCFAPPMQAVALRNQNKIPAAVARA